MNPKILQGIFNYMQNKYPDSKNLMNTALSKAMEAGKAHNNPAAVVGALKSVMSGTPYASRLNNPEINNILTSFEKQPVENVIPHAIKIANGLGVLPGILSWVGSKIFGDGGKQ